MEGGREEAGPGLEAPAGVTPAVANTPTPLGAQSGEAVLGGLCPPLQGVSAQEGGFSIALHMSEGCVHVCVCVCVCVVCVCCVWWPRMGG